MRIRVEQAELLPDLVHALRGTIDGTVTPVSDHDVRVSLSDSLGPTFVQVVLEHRLEVWRKRHPLAQVAIVDE